MYHDNALYPFKESKNKKTSIVLKVYDSSGPFLADIYLSIETRSAGSESYIIKDCHNIFDSKSGSGSIFDTILAKNYDQPLPSLEKKPTPITIISTKNQIEELRWNLGLNISEIANILRVKRPTVYEWLEEKTRRPRKQERLEIIYAICKKWEQFEIGRIGSYLHKKIDNNKSLFDLLNEDVLDNTLIIETLNKIKDDLMRLQNEKKQREEELKKAGFTCKPKDMEEIKKWIDRTIRKIG